MSYLQYPEWISPLLFPGLPFRWYAVMYLVAFVMAFWLFKVQVKERKLGITDDEVMNFFFWIIIGLLVGARIFAATIYDTTGTYRSAPWLIFWPFDGKGNFTGFAGMSYHGALVGIVVAMFFFAKVHKINLLLWGDLLAIATPLGYTFGRIGNFINGELWGRVSDLPWAMQFPNAPNLDMSKPWVADMAARTGVPIVEDVAVVNLPRHPSQLYEAFAEGILLFLFLWFVIRPKKNAFPGLGMSMYLVGYGLARFIVEYTREPDKGLDYVIRLGPVDAPPEMFVSLLNLSMGQILSLGMVVGGVGLYFFAKHLDSKKTRLSDFALSDDKIMSKNERRKIRKKLK